jgi:hypothetical protein
MQIVALVLSLFCLASCSRYLEVRLFNMSGVPVEVCSVSEGHKDCLSLANSSNGVLRWKEGMFVLQGGGCTVTFQASAPDALEDYRDNRDEPVNAVIGSDRNLLLVRRGQKPEEASATAQPPGFPIKGVLIQESCK